MDATLLAHNLSCLSPCNNKQAILSQDSPSHHPALNLLTTTSFTRNHSIHDKPPISATAINTQASVSAILPHIAHPSTAPASLSTPHHHQTPASSPAGTPTQTLPLHTITPTTDRYTPLMMDLDDQDPPTEFERLRDITWGMVGMMLLLATIYYIYIEILYSIEMNRRARAEESYDWDD